MNKSGEGVTTLSYHDKLPSCNTILDTSQLAEVMKTLDEVTPFQQRFWRHVFSFFLKHLMNVLELEKMVIDRFFERVVPVCEIFELLNSIVPLFKTDQAKKIPEVILLLSSHNQLIKLGFGNQC